MAKIKGEVDVDAQDEKILNAEFLPEVNALRSDDGLDPFASLDEYATFILQSAFVDYIEDTKDRRREKVGEKYDKADQALKDQIDALLEGV